MFPECVQNRFCPEIIGVPLGRQVGVTFWPCWCAEFHAGEHPRTKVGATTAGACRCDLFLICVGSGKEWIDWFSADAKARMGT